MPKQPAVPVWTAHWGPRAEVNGGAISHRPRGAPVRRTLEGKVAIVTGAGHHWRRRVVLLAMRLARGGIWSPWPSRTMPPRPDRHDLYPGADEDFAALDAWHPKSRPEDQRHALAVDVTDREQVRLVVEKTCQAFGGVELLGKGRVESMMTLLYAADMHGSEQVWRKFVNGAKFYGADTLILGGDLTGKIMVPIAEEKPGRYVAQVFGSLERVKASAI